jgi:hypothetical protein
MSRVSHANRLERLTRRLRGEPVVRIVCADWLRAWCIARDTDKRCQRECKGLGAKPAPTPEASR